MILLLNDSDGNVFTTNFTPGVKKQLIFSTHHLMKAFQKLKTRSTSESSGVPLGRDSRFS
jgi:hypothetical protein